METFFALLAICKGNSPVPNSLHKDEWRGALLFSLICVWINGRVNNREAGAFRCYRVHYDVSVMNINFTHCGLVTPYGVRHLVLYWFRCLLDTQLVKSWIQLSVLTYFQLTLVKQISVKFYWTFKVLIRRRPFENAICDISAILFFPSHVEHSSSVWYNTGDFSCQRLGK